MTPGDCVEVESAARTRYLGVVVRHTTTTYGIWEVRFSIPRPGGSIWVNREMLIDRRFGLGSVVRCTDLLNKPVGYVDA